MAGGVALLVRAFLIFRTPGIFAFDGFQRWAGREQLLIRDWLPATQSIIVLSSPFESPSFTRILLAILASVAVLALVQISHKTFGQRVGWYTVPIAAFGPFAVWSSTLYQEGTFLFICLGAIALATHLSKSWLWLADILAGAIALTRYEGWPVLFLYLVWRKDKRSLLALWGPILWILVKMSGVEGFAPSPIDYADWNGLNERFSWAQYYTHVSRFFYQSLESGALGVWLLALPAAQHYCRKKHPMTLLLVGIFLSQVAAVAGWIAGLETAIQRMQVILTVIAMPLSAATIARFVPAPRMVSIVLGLALIGIWTNFGVNTADRNHRSFRHERQLASEIQACSDCRWHIQPRQGLGTRNRHDGCEIIQGLSTLQHNRDFWCLAWGTPEFEATHVATWKKRGYTTTKTTP